MGAIRLYGSTSGYLELQAPAVAPDSVLTLPSTGFGKVLQVVRATDSTDRSTNSTSFQDSGISVTITPTLASSAVMLIWQGTVSLTASAIECKAAMSITDSANATVSGSELTSLRYTKVGDGTGALTYDDSVVLIGYATPATTSAVTYKVRFRAVGTSSYTISLSNATATGQFYAIEVAA